ncbi:hypothetical protein BS50DRAFT_43659 [Corynespora cassiicola Philippines]|uniref:Uncharacterized protein n=1 Tax=Corynespora cassiicola Philippines TaxID=1448308 RepID=A0A2T2PD99_CORCC|nr:hypothetical protein BS50DRAFT_43659 [Corynespora cassiicola Philippines]
MPLDRPRVIKTLRESSFHWPATATGDCAPPRTPRLHPGSARLPFNFSLHRLTIVRLCRQAASTKDREPSPRCGSGMYRPWYGGPSAPHPPQPWWPSLAFNQVSFSSHGTPGTHITSPR